MPRSKKPDPEPTRRRRGVGSVSYDPARRSWRARAPRDGTGARASESFATRAEAEAWLSRRLGGGGDDFDGRSTLGAYLNYWYAVQSPRWTPLTARRYRYELAACRPLAGYRLDRLRADHIQGLLADLLRRGLTRRYVYHLGRLLCRALASAVRWGILTENVAEDVDYPRPERAMVRAWSPEDVRRLLAVIRGQRFEPIFLLMLYAGLRIGEALAIRWTDLDWADGAVTVERAEWTNVGRRIGATKRERVRTVDLPAPVLARLREIRDARTVIVAEILGRPGGKRWGHRTLRKDWDAAIRSAGIPRLTPHAARRSWATALMAAGTPLADLAEMAGHASPEITARSYLSSERGRRRDAARRLGELFAERDEAARQAE